jgi:hypothetical protein
MAASANPPSRVNVANAVIASLDDPAQFDDSCVELLTSIQRLKLSRMPSEENLESAAQHPDGIELWGRGSAVVRHVLAENRFLRDIKTDRRRPTLITREATIH